MKMLRALGRVVCAGLLLAVWCVLGTGRSFGQDVSGSIAGVVKDSTGATVAGATVSIINTDRGTTIRTLTTSEGGVYIAKILPLGTYTVTVEATGFKKTSVDGIVLHVNDSLTVSPVLSIGASSETVNVTADALGVNLENATQAGLINGTQMRELVLSSRNYEQLVGLQPGVAYSGGDQIYIGNSNPSGSTNVVNFSVNGARTSGNNWTVDGADNVDRGSNYTLLTYPSVDAIAEFKTLRGNYSAEFGRSASGQINVVTKSGTNRLHGSAYEFVRNDIFNANDVLNKPINKPLTPRSKLRYNDFGYTIGGPVWIPKFYDGRNKTFFFFSQELRRVITYRAVTLQYVPSVAERQGNFTGLVCANVNATTGRCNDAGTRTITRIDPTAAAYLKDVYANVGAPDAAGNLVTPPQRNIFNANQQIIRIDQQVSQKLTAFFRFINDSIPTQEPGGLFQGTGYPGIQTTNTNAPGRIYLGHATYAWTPTFLLDGGYAFSSGALISDPVGGLLKANSPDINPTLPFPVTLGRVPTIAFTSGQGQGVTSYGPYRDYSRDHNIFVNVSKTIGAHSLRFGVNYNHYQKTENAAGNNTGSFTFSNAGAVTGSTVQAYQQAWANFLTGYVTTFTQASLDITPDLRVNQIEFFAQDDWKATPRLTLNYGIRYSLFNQPIDANHLLTTFDPSLYVAANAPTVDKSTSGNLCVAGAPCTGGVSPNPNANLLNGTSINGQNSPYGQKVGQADKLNFAPRVGFAFDVFGNGKTALRGGYGIAYDSSLFGTYEQNIFANKPFVNTPTISNTNFTNPAGTAANVSYSTAAVRATSPNFHTPYVQQFSLDFQQQLPTGVVLDVGYVGNHSVHLIGLVDINEAFPGAYLASNLSTVNAGVTTPVTVINTTTVNALNQIRPYRGYNAINSVLPIFSGNYNSLQISGQKQWKHDSQVAINYTWSRALTDSNADRTGAPQNSYNIRAEYGRAAADRTHMLNFNAVYSIPFFYEQHGLVGHLLGGWEVSALGFLNSGLPLNATTSGLDPAGLGVVLGSSVASGRPDRVSDPNSAGAGAPIHTPTRWFNTRAFAAVPAGIARPGNAGRNIINGPGWWRIDPGVFRNVKIVEGLNLQLRGETFNIFNHTNPDAVNTSGYTATGPGSATGTVTSYRDKRILQLGAKVIF